KSYDYGFTWSEPKIFYTTLNPLIAHYDFISDSENNFYLIHSTSNNYRIYFSYSTDLGETWSAPEFVCSGAWGSCFGTYGVVTLDVNNFEADMTKRARILTEGYYWTRKTGSWAQTGNVFHIKGRMFLDEIDKNIYAWGSTSDSSWNFAMSQNDGSNWNSYPKISTLASHRTNHSRTDRNILGVGTEGSNLIFRVFMPDSNLFTPKKTVFTGSFGFFEGFDDNVNQKYMVFFAGIGSNQNKIFQYEADYNGSDFYLSEVYNLGYPVKNFRIVRDILRLGIVADVNNNNVFQRLYFRIPPAKITITNPLVGQAFNQREPIKVTFQIRDKSNNLITYSNIARFKMKEDDEWSVTTINWNQEYSFIANAPDENGEYTLSLQALVDGQWIQSYTNYTVEPYDIDLKINFIKAIQAVENVDLVVGKATAVKVGVNNTNDMNREQNVAVRIEFNGQNDYNVNTFLGDYNFIFYIENPFEEEGTFEISAEVDWINQHEEIDENNNYAVTEATIKDVKDFVLIFTPVELDTLGDYTYNKDLFFGNYYISNFDTYLKDVNRMKNFLLSTYPLSNDHLIIIPKSSVFCLDKTCPTDANHYAGSQLSIFLDEILKQQWLAGLLSDPLNFEYRVIGVVPRNWFKDRVIGYNSNSGYTTSLAESVLVRRSGTIEVAHEVGHTIWNADYTLNFCEEYYDQNQHKQYTCANPNHPDCNSFHCSNYGYPPGICLGYPINNAISVKEKKEFTSVDSNLCNPQNTYSYMGTGDFNPPNRWTTYDEYQHLFSVFEISGGSKYLDTDINVLLLSGLVDINFNVELYEFYVTEGQEFGSSDGNCAVRTIDFNSMPLNDYNFSVYFYERSFYPPHDSNYSPFLISIPFSEDVNSVQVICNGELKAERFVSENSPTVSIISPSEGEHWSGDNSIEWAANDADGDDLEFVLQYSDDNGSTWNPLGMHITDENFTFDVGMVDGNTAYKIRVIATDGVLTGEAVSNTFSILNPNIEIEPSREWDLENINNLQNVSQDFNIVNTGNADLNVFDMNVSDNLTVTGLVLPLILEPDEKQSFSVDLNVLDMNLGEFNEYINLSSNDPNQIIKRIKVYGTIEEAKPDFQITADNITFNPVYPEEDENVVVSALVENVGDLNAVDVNVLFSVRGIDSFRVGEYTVALYHADSDSGTNLVDETGNHDGSFKGVGEPAWTENSKFGVSALSFDGIDDYVSVADHNDLDLTGELSVEFWFYSNGWNSSYQGILAKRSVSANYGTNVKNTAFQWYFREAGGSYQILAFSPPSAGTWHYFLGTFKQINSTTVEAKAYIDGILQEDSNLSGNLNNTVNTDDLIIGSSTIGYEPFNGLIDEIRISNSIRKPFEFLTEHKTIPFIDANSTELITFDWNSVKAGDYNAFITVDDENLFDEKDETNNQDYNSVTVCVDPELSLQFEFDALNDLGEPFDLNFIVENNGAKLLDANATLILPAELTTTDSLTKLIGDLNSHTSTKIEWHDINSSQAGLFEIIVNVQGTNADENSSVLTSIRHIDLNLNLNESVLPDESGLGNFSTINFNPNTTYTGLYYNVNITGPENHSYDENIGLLHASETKEFNIEWNEWKNTGNYTVTVSLYDSYDDLVDQKQDSFEVIPYTPSLLGYYSTDGLEFNPEFVANADYFSSAADESNQVMVVYSYDGDLNFSVRNPVSQEWSSPQNIGSGSYPYLVADGNDFHLVYVDDGVYYRFYDGSWSSSELVSSLNSVDPVITLDDGIKYVLFSSLVNGNYNVYLAGFNGSWNPEIELTHCRNTNCSNPVVLDEGLVDGKLSYGYRQYSGEEYSTLDSNLMFSLFDVNYFYWGNGA
ncbi:hypothetical protein KKB11_01020, partial [Candidatus Micrarchaeota archaeon]|nr:hypothetical protein [Candidatus Micrarchaeota archaeon]